MKLRLRANLLDIGTGSSLIVLLDDDTAKKMSVFVGDRVELSTSSKKRICTVDLAKNEPQDTIGIFEETAKALGVRQGQIITVNPSDKPASLKYIREKIAGKSLNYSKFFTILSDLAENKLTSAETAYFVSAIYTRGCDLYETLDLINAMVDTGSRLKWNKQVVSKHCIGGISGNRTTMLLVPILTAAGLMMPKTSSRAITSPAGTADTMEVLAPVEVNSLEHMRRVVSKTGGCMVWGGALNLAPADDKIIRVEHALGIDPEPMLLASILAKKKAEGANIVLIDIPVGKYSKVRNTAIYNRLRREFLWLGKRLGMKMKVIRSIADGPVGNGVGPVLEARDILWTLKRDKRAPKDLEEKTIEMAGIILKLAKKTHTEMGGRKLARSILNSGRAYKKMQDIIKAQGGDPFVEPEDLKLATYSYTFRASCNGVIKEISDDAAAEVAKAAGAPKDASAGLYLHAREGNKVSEGMALFTIFSNSDERLKYAMKLASGVISFK